MSGGQRPYDFAVVDEAQDLGVAEARFLVALGGGRPNAPFFVGDLGQRIFRTPFSWKSLGIDVRGRSFTLRVNYRTSHQIHTQADLLLPGAIADVDGNEESRKGTISVYDGPPPVVRVFDDPEAEARAVGDWVAARIREGLRPEEVGVFVRSQAEMDRARAAAKFAGAEVAELAAESEGAVGRVAISPCTSQRASNFAPSPPWPATTRFYRCRSVLKQWPTTRISRRLIIPNDTCSTSPAPDRHRSISRVRIFG